MNVLRIVFALACTLVCLGCSTAFRAASVDASQAIVPIVVDESLQQFEDPRTRERVREILGTPEMQAAIQESAHAVMLGALQPEDSDRIQVFTAELTRTVSEVLATEIREKLLPASVEGMREAMRGALSPDTVKGLSQALNAAVAQATGAAIRSAAVELPRSLAPALRASIVESLNSPDLRESVAGITAEATRTALLSSRDVLVELHERGEAVGPVERIVVRVERLVVTSIVATFAVGTLVGALIVWAIRFRRGGGRGDPPTAAHGADARGERLPPRLDHAPTRAS